MPVRGAERNVLKRTEASEKARQRTRDANEMRGVLRKLLGTD